MQGSSQRRPLQRHGVAFLLVSAAASARLMLLQSLGLRAPYITFYPAVILAALYGGFWAGLLATLLSAFAAAYFWIEPVGSFSIAHPADLLGMAIFVINGVLISGITEAMHRAQARARAAEAEVRISAERKRADEEIRESEERYRSLFENMLDGYAHCRMIFDNQGRPADFVYLNVNSAFEKLTGLKDVVGKKVTEIIPGVKEMSPEIFEVYGRVALTGVQEKMELHFKPLDKWLAINVYSAEKGSFIAVFDDVTERKLGEEALRESEAQFRSLADAIPNLCWIANSDGWIFWYNRRWYEYTGTTPAQMEGWGWQSVHNPATLPGVLEKWKSSIATGSPFDMVFPLRGADGVFRPFLTRVMPMLDKDGKVVRWFGTNTDITDQKRSEDELEALVEERTAELVEQSRVTEAFLKHSASPLVFLDKEFNFMRVNEAYARICARDVSDFSGHNHFVDYPSDELKREFERVVETKEPYSVLGRPFVFPDHPEWGTTYWDLYVYPIMDDKGELEFLAFSLNDVTSHKHAEEEVRESEKRYRMLYDAIDEGFCIIEMIFDEHDKPVDYRFLEINPSFEKQTGLVDAQGKRMRELAPNHEEHWFEIYGKIALTGEPARFQNRAEQLHRWYDVYAFRFGRPEDRQVGILFNDITERKRAEDEALRMQKLESLRVLAGGIAHDLNNLMVAVSANAGLALDKLGTESSAARHIQAIEDASEKVAAFSKQILSFTGRSEAVKEPVQLNDVVEDTARLVMASVPAKARLEYSLSDSLPPIMADPLNMQQVVMNLIINASEALGDAGGEVKVSTGMLDARRTYLDNLHPAGLPEGAYVYLKVSDTGCGISPETRKRIFDPFFTTKFTGRGLGLSAVFGIVHSHGGAIGLESEAGRGSTFTVLLPVPESPVAVVREEPSARESLGGKGTILVVDDEINLLDMAKTVLETYGYDVITASDGTEAVRVFSERPGLIDAVIMDLIMPRVRGDQAAREMRKVRDDVNIVFLSGYHELDLDEFSGGPGRTAFLEKPYKVAKLLGAVQDITMN